MYKANLGLIFGMSRPDFSQNKLFVLNLSFNRRNINHATIMVIFQIRIYCQNKIIGRYFIVTFYCWLQLDKNGYLVVENFLSPEQCDELRKECVKIVDDCDVKDHQACFDTINEQHMKVKYFPIRE